MLQGFSAWLLPGVGKQLDEVEDFTVSLHVSVSAHQSECQSLSVCVDEFFFKCFLGFLKEDSLLVNHSLSTITYSGLRRPERYFVSPCLLPLSTLFL